MTRLERYREIIEQKHLTEVDKIDLIAGHRDLLAVAEAAKECAEWYWGTSVSEAYHLDRLFAMDRMRVALAPLLKEEVE